MREKQMAVFFYQAVFKLCQYSAWVGMATLVIGVFATTADIVLRGIGFDGVFGVIDVVQLTVMVAAFLSIPFGFLMQSHVSVSLFVDRFGLRGAAVLHMLAASLAAVCLAAIGWFGYDQAMMQLEYGDVSLTLGVLKFYYWLPLLYGAGLSVLVCVCMFLGGLAAACTGKGNGFMIAEQGGHV
jgi:TRAP-type C4-dicarboxylate transport system permease small subunit